MTIFYPLFAIALFASTVYADVTWSIDCGSSTSSIDDNLISWIGDDTVITTGQANSVSATYLSSDVIINTLRAFPSGTKNCYVLEGEKGAKVQLRAMFYYGNYDGESAPPTFGLQFDGNEWATVETTLDIDTYLYYDVIYVTKGDNINVCLIQTNPNQVPFISAIEVRTLTPTMYALADSGIALFHMSRFCLSTTFIRYPTDAYDRFWSNVSLTAGSSFARLTYDGFVIDTSTSSDEPPQEALMNALTNSSTSVGTLAWTISNLPTAPILVYLKLYFSEMTDLASTQKRAFSVYIGDTLLESTVGFEPPYGEVTVMTIRNAMMSQTTGISLVPEADSTESPLVNAVEVFQVSNYIVTYTSATSSPSPPTPSSPSPPTSSSPSPPISRSPSPPIPRSPSPPHGGSGDDTPPASFSGGSSTGTQKSKLPLILGVGVPVFVFLTVFLTVAFLLHRKRKHEALTGAGAAGGGAANNGQLPFNNGHNNQMMNNGQGVAMNEFTPNNGGHDLYTPDRPYPPPQPMYPQQPQH